jgi:hypothetical protein
VSKLIVTLLSSLIMLFALSLLVQTSLSQSSAISESEEDRSFYLNQPVLHPEALSGIWETPIGNGGAVGIYLQLATKLPDDSRIPWTPQAWQHLDGGIYERKTTDEAFGDINGFSDSKRGGAFRTRMAASCFTSFGSGRTHSLSILTSAYRRQMAAGMAASIGTVLTESSRFAVPLRLTRSGPARWSAPGPRLPVSE